MARAVNRIGERTRGQTMTDETPGTPRRRRVLKLLGASAITTGLAGCSDDSGSDGSDDENSGDEPSPESADSEDDNSMDDGSEDDSEKDESDGDSDNEEHWTRPTGSERWTINVDIRPECVNEFAMTETGVYLSTINCGGEDPEMSALS